MPTVLFRMVTREGLCKERAQERREKLFSGGYAKLHEILSRIIAQAAPQLNVDW